VNPATRGSEATRVPRVGVALGDVTGIGPEVALKALQRAVQPDRDAGVPRADFLILGDLGWLERANRAIGLELDLDSAPGAGIGRTRVCVRDPRPEPLSADLSPGAAPAARAAVDWLRYGAQRCLAGELDALVTAPVNKGAIERAGIPFIGQTEFLAELAGVPDPIMMLLGDDDRGRWLRVALVTTHLAMRDVPSAITTAAVRLAISRAAHACHLLGLARARVAVCGLNPHSGEGGLFGSEEIEVIGPALLAARAEGLDVLGPFPADTLFHQALEGSCDAVVAMYHDQGLAPLKLIAFDTGVNWTLGLPFIRTSPDHGTAYDLAGKNVARPDSMLAAIRLAVRLGSSRAVASPRAAGGGSRSDVS